MIQDLQGAGIGLRKEFINEWLSSNPAVDFIELVPENWIGIGGKLKQQLSRIAERYPCVTHGLSLSIASSEPLDWNFLKALKLFLNEYPICVYSDHLSYASDQGHLYDLLPIPFSEEAIFYISDRIRQVQDFLERPLTLENISYYADVSIDMKEVDFIKAILNESKCQLLLDVNNVYVNSVNHQYDPEAFIEALPSEAIAYIHIAGHKQVEPNLIIDTHAADVIDPVWDLLTFTYQQKGVKPTLLERDDDFPPLSDLLKEVNKISVIQSAFNSKLNYKKSIENYA